MCVAYEIFQNKANLMLKLQLEDCPPPQKKKKKKKKKQEFYLTAAPVRFVIFYEQVCSVLLIGHSLDQLYKIQNT